MYGPSSPKGYEGHSSSYGFLLRSMSFEEVVCHAKFFDAREASYEERRMVEMAGIEPASRTTI